MEIIVAIKQVPDTLEAEIDPETHTLIRAGLPTAINSFDEIGIELALQLRQRHGGRVTILSMGPKSAIRAIQTAYAMGADRGVLLNDRRLAGSDTWATAVALAAAIRKLGPFDLLIFGKQASDGDTAQVGPEVAQLCDVPQVTYVVNVRSLDLSGRRIEVERILERGRQRVRASLPALLTVTKGEVFPHFPTLAEVLAARKKEVAVWGLDELGLARDSVGLRGSPTRVRQVFSPTHNVNVELFEGAVTEAVPRLVDRLLGGGAIR